ncbi:MAG: phosphoribosylglycinamide formyltransferase [Erysipelotrichaceae bacterium]
MVKAAVFGSGSGTNFEEIARAKISGLELVFVLSDQEEAYILERAKNHQLPAICVTRSGYESKAAFEAAMLSHLESNEIELIILAGFMRILSPEFVAKYPNRIINIHPSLLPAFPGKHSIQQAWDAGVTMSGCSVHYVDEGIDTGVLLGQSQVKIDYSEGFAAFEAAIHAAEYELYPSIIKKIIEEMENQV